MASSTLILILIVLVTISSPLLHQIHARESQFFSKVTNTPTQTETVLLADKEKEQQSLVNKQETEQEQQQPEFVPQHQNGHGLYGQENGEENGQETKSGVQTQTPGTYVSEKIYNYNNDRNRAETETEQFGNREGGTFYVNNGEKYYSSNDQNDDALLDFADSKERKDDAPYYYKNHNGVSTEHYTTESRTQKDNLGETETYYTNTDKNSRFGSQLGQTETNYYDNGFTNTRYNTYTGTSQNRGGSNVERQGTSDTRFLENGRYYYDLNKEEQKQYANQNTYSYNHNPKSNYNSEFGNMEYQTETNEVDRVNDNYYYNNKFYDNIGGEKYEFKTMEEYERSRRNQYDP